MALSLLLLLLGLALLIGGADLLVRGVSALAAALGVSPLVIGLTVVAFGTSTPELVVNAVSAAKAQTGLAFGNVVGSCAINIGFVLALTALIRPLQVQVTVISREIPMMLLAVAAVVIMSEDQLFAGAAADVLNRNDGLMLLLLFCVFLYYITLQALGLRKTDALLEEIAEEAEPRPRQQRMGAYALITLLGLAGVGLGGRITVDSAVTIAQGLGVSEAVIGLTLVSFGTTLPELTTSLLAARRGHADIAIGNIVGSCIYNLLFIAGVVATIHPIEIPRFGQYDLLMMAGLSAALWPIALRGPRKITRAEGAFLLIAYLSYVGYRTIFARGE